MKKIINLLIIYFLFTTFSHSKISTDAQKSLINNNMIYKGLPCNDLTSLLGGIKKISSLFLGNKNQQDNQYVLINLDNKEDYKVFYVCKKYRNNYTNTSKKINLLMDQDVEKIFYDPIELFSYIFSITSDQSTKYILSRLQKTEFNISTEELKLAHLKSMKKEKTSKYITKKKKKKKKKLTEQSIILEHINKIKSGDYYLFAHSTNGEIFWGSTKTTTETIQSGTVFSSNGRECLIASIQKTESAPFKGTFRLVCNNKKIEGSWTQKNINSPGLGKAFTDDGDIINAFFSKNRNEINKFVTNYYTKGETKIAKVVENNQPEFKPKVKKLDKTPPNLITKENITVADTSYFITGEIKDEGSEILYVKIEDEIIQTKNGKFKFKRFSPVDEKITIVAIDQWGNESKPKIINVKIDIKDTIAANKIEKLNPSKLSTASKSSKVAIIFGIEKYEKSPKATYANLDGKYFYEYARKAFGISKENIKLLIDDEAKLTNTFIALEKWLPPKIKKNQTELLIFYAGHGLASTNGEELYILPQNSDPDLLNRTALSRKELFDIILALEPKSVTMFFDTCYSGVSRDEQMLLADARPLMKIPEEQPSIPKNFTIFSASELDQISSGLKEAKHGIFSYYVMKGLEGNADVNNDRKITNGELLSYLKDHVPLKASELGRQQNPSLAGDPDKILIRY